MILSHKESSEEVRISGITTRHSSLIFGEKIEKSMYRKMPNGSLANNINYDFSTWANTSNGLPTA